MKWTFSFITILFLLTNCSDKNNDSQKLIQQIKDIIVPNQIDSILNFDSIKAIYSCADIPPKITDDALEDGENRPPLYTDSINKWTNSKIIIDSIRQIFPKLTKFKGGIIESTCCGHREILIETTNNEITFSWNFNTSDSAVFINTIPYSSDKKTFNKIYRLLDRKIITKEIFLKDSIKFSLKDKYNSKYSRTGYETRFVYILK